MICICKGEADTIIFGGPIVSKGASNARDWIDVDTALAVMSKRASVDFSFGCQTANAFIRAGVTTLARQAIIELTLILERLVSSFGARGRELRVEVTIVALRTVLRFM